MKKDFVLYPTLSNFTAKGATVPLLPPPVGANEKVIGGDIMTSLPRFHFKSLQGVGGREGGPGGSWSHEDFLSLKSQNNVAR